jgi:glucokinase
MENDANAEALGEYYFGSGEKDSYMIRVAIGTGIGTGIIQDGYLLGGLNRNAGEAGHIIIDRDGILSQEGIDGSWEAYCSGRGFLSLRAACILH